MPQNLKPLTALRFFAAMWVVAFHFWPNLGVAMPAIVGKGYLGVELFFVLSGFILSHVYLERFKNGTYHYGEFIWARLARIYPVHIAILVGLGLLMAGLTVVGIQAGDKLLVWSSLPAQVTLTQAWGLAPQGGWNHPSWSISAEWFAYLTFPAFAFLMVPMWNRPRLAVGLAAAFLILLYIAFGSIAGFPLTRATILWGALRIVPCFALGCTLWLLWNSGAIRTRAIASGVTLGGFSSLVASTLFGLPDFVSVLACGGIILGLGALARNGSSILSSSWLVYLGEVSFAVYMICIPWQLVFSQGLQKLIHIDPEHMPVVLWLIMVAGVVPAAIVVHHLIERPARNLMRRVDFKRDAVNVRVRLKIEY